MLYRRQIHISNLLLDTSNYRIVKQASQKAARDAIIAEQNKKLLNLAKDIIKNGLNPCDLPMAIPSPNDKSNYIVIEGNRRLSAIQIMRDPDLAKDTPTTCCF